MFTEEQIKSLENIGIRLVGIYMPSNRVGLSWSQAYPDPEYRWSTTELPITQERYAFDHGATMFGRTHIKDPETGEYLNLNALDTDCQIAHNRLTIHINQLLDASSWDWVTDKFRDLVKAFLSSAGVVNGNYNQSLLDILKKSTFVTKTRKECGHHLYWLSRQQRKAIGVADCKKGYEFEIKTDNSLGLCTLPGSAHKEDLNFRYTSVGITESILANDLLYDLFVEMFKDCIVNGKLDDKQQEQQQEDKEGTASSSNSNDTRNQSQDKKKSYNRTVNIKNLIILSPSTIKSSAGYLSPFVGKGYRNEFYVRLSGMMFHARISEESAAQVIAGLCAITADEEAKFRQGALTATYQKGFDGEEIEGAPKLAQLIADKVSGQDLVSATLLLDNLKYMWRMDRKATRQREETQLVNKSIAEAKRTQSGYVQVRGSIVGMSTVYQMFKSADITCESCNHNEKVTYDIPAYRPHVKERSRCPVWSKGHAGGDTAIAEYEYISTVDIWIQDLDKTNDLNRLQVKLFDNNTNDVNTGEVVDVIGCMHVVRNNDSLNSKPECVLFSEDLIYTKRKEVTLTQEDKDKIQAWKEEIEKQGKNPIDEAVKKFAPEMIGYDHIKKGLFVQCANAGIKNDSKRFPIRMRLNFLLIGDPSTAKGALSSADLRLIPNCQSVSGMSTSGISMVAVVNRDSSGSMSVNLGTFALAKDAIGRVNEIGRMKLSEQTYLFDVMEEGEMDMVKYGFPANIECHASVLATANPLSNKWKHDNKITVEEFPILLQVTQRFDLIYILRERRDDAFIDNYVDNRDRIAENYDNGVYDGDLEWLQKYITYARSFNPKIPHDVKMLLKHFYKQMAKTKIDGLPRKFDGLLRISTGIARLKLKSTVDVYDAKETMEMFQEMLNEYEYHVGIPREPRDVAYEEIRQVVKDTYNIVPGGIEYIEAAKKACERNTLVMDYLVKDGKLEDSLKQDNNFKLRPIQELLRKDPNIIIVGERPIVMKWNPDGNLSPYRRSLNDANDANDVTFSDTDENILEGDQKGTSLTSSTSSRILVEPPPKPLPVPLKSEEGEAEPIQPYLNCDLRNQEGADRFTAEVARLGRKSNSKFDDIVEANLSGKGVMFGNKEQDDDEENVS